MSTSNSKWTTTSAPIGLWKAITSDSTGMYLAAVNHNGGIYASSSG
jgi:hypothetical protein